MTIQSSMAHALVGGLGRPTEDLPRGQDRYAPKREAITYDHLAVEARVDEVLHVLPCYQRLQEQEQTPIRNAAAAKRELWGTSQNSREQTLNSALAGLRNLVFSMSPKDQAPTILTKVGERLGYDFTGSKGEQGKWILEAAVQSNGHLDRLRAVLNDALGKAEELRIPSSDKLETLPEEKRQGIEQRYQLRAQKIDEALIRLLPTLPAILENN